MDSDLEEGEIKDEGDDGVTAGSYRRRRLKKQYSSDRRKSSNNSRPRKSPTHNKNNDEHTPRRLPKLTQPKSSGCTPKSSKKIRRVETDKSSNSLLSSEPRIIISVQNDKKKTVKQNGETKENKSMPNLRPDGLMSPPHKSSKSSSMRFTSFRIENPKSRIPISSNFNTCLLLDDEVEDISENSEEDSRSIVSINVRKPSPEIVTLDSSPESVHPEEEEDEDELELRKLALEDLMLRLNNDKMVSEEEENYHINVEDQDEGDADEPYSPYDDEEDSSKPIQSTDNIIDQGGVNQMMSHQMEQSTIATTSHPKTRNGQIVSAVSILKEQNLMSKTLENDLEGIFKPVCDNSSKENNSSPFPQHFGIQNFDQFSSRTVPIIHPGDIQNPMSHNQVVFPDPPLFMTRDVDMRPALTNFMTNNNINSILNAHPSMGHPTGLPSIFSEQTNNAINTTVTAPSSFPAHQPFLLDSLASMNPFMQSNNYFHPCFNHTTDFTMTNGGGGGAMNNSNNNNNPSLCPSSTFHMSTMNPTNYMDSLNQSMAQLQWPSFVPITLTPFSPSLGNDDTHVNFNGIPPILSPSPIPEESMPMPPPLPSETLLPPSLPLYPPPFQKTQIPGNNSDFIGVVASQDKSHNHKSTNATKLHSILSFDPTTTLIPSIPLSPVIEIEQRDYFEKTDKIKEQEADLDEEEKLRQDIISSVIEQQKNRPPVTKNLETLKEIFKQKIQQLVEKELSSGSSSRKESSSNSKSNHRQSSDKEKISAQHKDRTSKHRKETPPRRISSARTRRESGNKPEKENDRYNSSHNVKSSSASLDVSNDRHQQHRKSTEGSKSSSTTVHEGKNQRSKRHSSPELPSHKLSDAKINSKETRGESHVHHPHPVSSSSLIKELEEEITLLDQTPLGPSKPILLPSTSVVNESTSNINNNPEASTTSVETLPPVVESLTEVPSDSSQQTDKVGVMNFSFEDEEVLRAQLLLDISRKKKDPPLEIVPMTTSSFVISPSVGTFTSGSSPYLINRNIINNSSSTLMNHSNNLGAILPKTMIHIPSATSLSQHPYVKDNRQSLLRSVINRNSKNRQIIRVVNTCTSPTTTTTSLNNSLATSPGKNSNSMTTTTRSSNLHSIQRTIINTNLLKTNNTYNLYNPQSDPLMRHLKITVANKNVTPLIIRIGQDESSSDETDSDTRTLLDKDKKKQKKLEEEMGSMGTTVGEKNDERKTDDTNQQFKEPNVVVTTKSQLPISPAKNSNNTSNSVLPHDFELSLSNLLRTSREQTTASTKIVLELMEEVQPENRQEMPPTVTIPDFDAAKEREELYMREKLLKATLLQKMKDSKDRLVLRKLEKNVVSSRRRINQELTTLLSDMVKISDLKTLYKNEQEKVALLRKQLCAAVKKVNSTVECLDSEEKKRKALTSSVFSMRKECVQLVKECREQGSMIEGSNYKVPSAESVEMKSKLVQVRNQNVVLRGSGDCKMSPKKVIGSSNLYLSKKYGSNSASATLAAANRVKKFFYSRKGKRVSLSGEISSGGVSNSKLNKPSTTPRQVRWQINRRAQGKRISESSNNKAKKNLWLTKYGKNGAEEEDAWTEDSFLLPKMMYKDVMIYEKESIAIFSSYESPLNSIKEFRI